MLSVALDTTPALYSGVEIMKIRCIIACMLLFITLFIVSHFQDIAVTRGAGAVVDYSVLYDNIVRATLWEEVRFQPFSLLFFIPFHLLFPNVRAIG